MPTDPAAKSPVRGLVAAVLLAGAGLTPALAGSSPAPTPADALEADRRAVWQSEEAFAAAFAARDPERFATFVADDAVFSGRTDLRGKAAVVEAWTQLMTAGPTAPFSWRPTRVLVHGDTALSSGPIHGADGSFSGAFTSVWQRQADGSWKVVIDGAAPCVDPATRQVPAPAPAPTPPPTPGATPGGG